MNFRHLLDEKLKSCGRFSGVTCGEECDTAWVKKGLVGYVLDGAVGREEGKTVRAGIILDTDIVGVFHSVGTKVYQVRFAAPKFLGDMDFVITTLWECLSDNLDIGNKRWAARRFEKAVPAKVTNFRQIKNEHTSNRPIVFHNVLVDFGFDSTFTVLAFAWVDDCFVAAVAEQSGKTIKPCYEMVLDSADEMNRLYLQVKRSSFVSKKGNTIYKIDAEMFSSFHRVDGNWFMLG